MNTHIEWLKSLEVGYTWNAIMVRYGSFSKPEVVTFTVTAATKTKITLSDGSRYSRITGNRLSDFGPEWLPMPATPEDFVVFYHQQRREQMMKTITDFAKNLRGVSDEVLEAVHTAIQTATEQN